jgi:hypothetical protein
LRELAAFDAQHIELAFDVAEDEVGFGGECLFDHLVGAGEQSGRNFKADRADGWTWRNAAA